MSGAIRSEVRVMDGRQQFSWVEIKATLKRRARLIALCFAALAAGAVAAVLAAPPTYEGEAKVLVKRDRADSVVSGAPEAAANREELTEADLVSQAELIKSRDILERVASDAGLVDRVLAEEPSLDRQEALAAATKALDEELAVTPIRRTWLIDIVYGSEDPRLTRNVLDTLVQQYLEKHLALHRPAGTHQFFAEQTHLARAQLDEAQARLVEFGRSHDVVSAGREKEKALDQLATFDTMRSEARALLAATTQQLTAIKSNLSAVPAQRRSEVRTTDAAGVVEEISARIITLELRRTELLQRFTPGYRGVLEIDEQLRAARAALDAARQNPIREETIADNPTHQWLDTERARVQAENAAIRARLASLSAAVGEYRNRAQALSTRELEQQDLLRRLKEAEDKYLLYARKQEEARISDELDKTRIANVVLAQAPAVSLEATRTPSLAMLPLLLLVSLLLSGAVALVWDAAAATGPLVTKQELATQIWIADGLSHEEKRRAVLALHPQQPCPNP